MSTPTAKPVDQSPTIIDGKVVPDEIYAPPGLIHSTWFKTWALKCGKCHRDFWRFSFFGRPRCPYCHQVNKPQYSTYM